LHQLLSFLHQLLSIIPRQKQQVPVIKLINTNTRTSVWRRIYPVKSRPTTMSRTKTLQKTGFGTSRRASWTNYCDDSNRTYLRAIFCFY